MLSQIARILVIVGGVDLGLRGLGMLMDSNWDVLNLILGGVPILEAIIYVIIGIAAVKMIWSD